MSWIRWKFTRFLLGTTAPHLVVGHWFPLKQFISLTPSQAYLHPSKELGFLCQLMSLKSGIFTVCLHVINRKPQTDRCVDVPGTCQRVSHFLWVPGICSEWGSPGSWGFWTAGVTFLRKVLGIIPVVMVMLTLHLQSRFPKPVAGFFWWGEQTEIWEVKWLGRRHPAGSRQRQDTNLIF